MTAKRRLAPFPLTAATCENPRWASVEEALAANVGLLAELVRAAKKAHEHSSQSHGSTTPEGGEHAPESA